MTSAKGFLYKHRIEFAVLGVFFAMIASFAIASPRVFLNYRAYTAVFTTLGASIILVTANVFVVASGEMDLSFPSIIWLSYMVFGVNSRAGVSPWLGLFASLVTGSVCGFLNGLLVT
ncbi:MAG: ABC transporter permease, partial [Armatimonadetes bacterium]|nr:ABC transporter permease [Armatimonadota bacterium]